ncbi:helix-turn-helix domain-containing protein [Bradyrhizobium sp. TZ2]
MSSTKTATNDSTCQVFSSWRPAPLSVEVIRQIIREGRIELRKKKGYSLDELARLSGASKSYLWELENRDERKPSAEKLIDIARVLSSPMAMQHIRSYKRVVFFGPPHPASGNGPFGVLIVHIDQIVPDRRVISDRAARPDDTGNVPVDVTVKRHSPDRIIRLCRSHDGVAEREFPCDDLWGVAVDRELLVSEGYTAETT